VCAHYINPAFELVDRCIELDTYKATHSAADMKATIKAILLKHGFTKASGTTLEEGEEIEGYNSGSESSESDEEELLADVELV
jgi:hypothetical protein